MLTSAALGQPSSQSATFSYIQSTYSGLAVRLQAKKKNLTPEQSRAEFARWILARARLSPLVADTRATPQVEICSTSPVQPRAHSRGVCGCAKLANGPSAIYAGARCGSVFRSGPFAPGSAPGSASQSGREPRRDSVCGACRLVQHFYTLLRDSCSLRRSSNPCVEPTRQAQSGGRLYFCFCSSVRHHPSSVVRRPFRPSPPPVLPAI